MLKDLSFNSHRGKSFRIMKWLKHRLIVKTDILTFNNKRIAKGFQWHNADPNCISDQKQKFLGEFKIVFIMHEFQVKF